MFLFVQMVAGLERVRRGRRDLELPSFSTVSRTLVEASMRQMPVGSMFGSRLRAREQLLSSYVNDWQTDSYARGAYSYVMVCDGGA